jgi:hypothetical protein
VLSMQESADAKERGSIAGGVEAWSRKARLKKTVVGPVDGHLFTILRGSPCVH